MAFLTFPTVHLGILIQAEVSSGGLTRKYRVNATKYGDGYEQVTPRGINVEQDEWKLKFVLPYAAAGAVTDFLDARKGAEPFYWTPPRGVSGLVRAGEYNRGSLQGDSETISCTFMRWYGSDS